MGSTEKNYKTVDDLKFEEWHSAQMRAEHEFENGWGVSVIANSTLAKKYNAFFEVAVLRNGHMDETTEVTKEFELFSSIEELNNCLRDIQDLDENGIIQRPKEKNHDEIKKHIEQRKVNIKKSRQMRKRLEKQNPMEKVSGVGLADEIARDVISGKETRTITPEIGAAIKRKKAFEK